MRATRRLSFVMLILACAPLAQAQLVIDDFSESQTALEVVWPTTIDWSFQSAMVLGGERDLEVEIFAALGVGSVASAEVTGGAFVHETNGTNVIARTSAIYDGVDTDASVDDGDGLGGLDLTTYDRFRLRVASGDQDWVLGIRVYSADNLYSGATVNVPASAVAQDVDVEFSTFAEEADADGPASFDTVGAIAFAIGFESPTGANGSVVVEEFSAVAGSPNIFSDDFESGGTASWSSTQGTS
jgi:hypothetical protein